MSDELDEAALREQVHRLELTEPAVKRAQARARALTSLAATVGGLCILVALIIAALTIQGARSSDKSNGQRITELTDELREARQVIEASTAVEAARDDCIRRFSSAVSLTLSDYLATLGDLVVAGVSLPAGDERNATIDATIEQLRTELAAYRDIVRDRNDWDQAGSPLPCPLD